MTDYDRGAYTPQTDAPLAFDPRRPSERRPMPMALIGSAAVLAILLAGVAMVYRGGVRHAGESPRPVGEPVMAVKTAPTAAQSAQNAPAAAPPSDLDVYSSGLGNTVGTAQLPASPSQPAKTAAAPPAATSPPAPAAAPPATVAQAPTFAPPAEQPAPRPAPKPSTVAMLARPSAPNHIERPATPDEDSARSLAAEAPKPAKPVKAAAAPHPASHAKIDQAELAAAGGTRTAEAEPVPAAHKAKAETADEDDAAAAPAKSRPVETAAASAGLSGKAAVVQIGAFSSTALADKGYADVSAALPGKMAGKAKHVQPLDKDGSTLYRTWLSGFASRADAQAFCEALKAKGKTCLVKG